MQKKRIKKGRKQGQFFADAITDMIAFVVLILVIIIAYVIFHSAAQPAENAIGSDVSQISYERTIANFLKTPIDIDVDGDGDLDKITMSEYITYASINDADYRKNLEKEIETFFDYFYADGWKIDIVLPDGTKLSAGHSHLRQKIGTYVKSLALQVSKGPASVTAYSVVDTSYKKQFYIPSLEDKNIVVETNIWILFAF